MRTEVPADALVVLYGATGVEQARIAYPYLQAQGYGVER